MYEPGYMAGIPEEYGRDMPITSRAELMVFAVYIPPHAPGEGHPCLTTSKRCSSVIFPTV